MKRNKKRILERIGSVLVLIGILWCLWTSCVLELKVYAKETAGKETTREETVQEKTAGEETAQKDSVQEKTAGEETAQEETTGEEIVQEETARKETVQEEPAGEATVQEETAQGESVQDEGGKSSAAAEETKEKSKEQLSFMERVAAVERAVIEQEGGNPDAVIHGARKARSIRKTVADVLGMDGTKYMEWMYSHENDTYYVTTPYNPGWVAGSGMSGDYRNPNGDCQGAYGAADTPGVPGMNCTGFVWHALMMPTAQSGGDVGMIPGISGWVTFYTNNDIERGYFQTKEEMLSSGYLEKGDIIWMFDESESTLSDYHHVGIYWGDGNQDSFWHSINGASDGGGMPYDGNIVSHIFAKSYNPFYVVVKTGGIEPEGNLEIQKASSMPEMTDGNSVYSLAGAMYGLYKDGVETARLTTDENGYAYADGIKPDQYTLKEISAPYGYAMDETEYPVTINSGQTTRQELTDDSQSNPVSVLLKKVDADTAQEKPQGNASLAGAEFTFKFYGVSSDTDPALAGIEPLRTWVMKTNERGGVRLDGNYKTSGHDFYFTTNGKSTLPLGTLTIQETEAPRGYVLNPEVCVRKITAEGFGEHVATYNAPLVKETVSRGGVVVQKRDHETGDGTPQGSASLAGAEFTITSLNDNPVTVNGTDYIKGQVVKTIVTDEQGMAKTAEKELPYGSYRLTETKAPAGYKLSGVLTRDFTISTDGQVISLTAAGSSIRDNVVRGGVKIQKRDHESGKDEPQGKAVLKGAEFAITSLNVNPVKVNGILYTKGQTVKTVVADENGIAQTRENELPFGTYRVTETKAPKGYQLSGVLTRDFTIDTDGQMVSLTAADKSIRDNVVRGGVKVQKRDNETGKDKPQGKAALKGAEFAVISRNVSPVIVNGTAYGKGQVVKTIVTDENGIAKTDAKELPYGSYTIRETKAPEGYNLSGVVSINFEIEGHGKIIELTTEDISIRDDIIRGDVEIIKLKEIENKDEDTFEGLKGVEFTFTSDTTGKVVKKIVTDKNGFATTADKAHPRGGLIFDTYTVTETKCPDGLKPIEPFHVTIREEGAVLKGIYKEDKLIVSPVTVMKVDGSTGKTIPIADTEFRLLDADKKPMVMTTYYPDKVVHKTFHTDKNGQFTFPDKLEYGTYYLEELNAPEGYLKGELLEFEVTEGAVWEKPLVVKYADENAMGRISITKISEDEKSKLQGAVFEIRAAEDIITPDGTLRMKKGEHADTVMTGQDGGAVTKLLYLGKYDVEEIQQPEGYVLNKEVVTVELRYKDQFTSVVTKKLTVTNKPVEIEIRKLDSGTEKPLEGAVFEIWNKEMKKAMENDMKTETTQDMDPDIDMAMGVTEEYVTDKDGKIIIRNLSPGTYCIRETKALPGYVLQDEIYEMTIDKDGTVEGKERGDLTVANEFTKVELSKHDLSTEKEIEGGKYQVLDKKGNIVDEWRGKKEPHQIERLTVGETYIFSEILAPKGYLIGQSIEFTVEATGKMQKVKMYDELAMGTIIVHKTDSETKNNVSGAYFEVYAAEDIVTPDGVVRLKKGELADRIRTVDGTAKTKELFLGKYDLVESRAASGYILEKKRYSVKLKYKDQDTAVVTETIHVENTPTTIVLEKVKAGTDETMEGVKFRIWNKAVEAGVKTEILPEAGGETDMNEGVYEEYVTDKDGRITWKYLTPGTYCIQETATIPGYILNDEIYEITVDQDGKAGGKDVGKLRIENTPIKPGKELFQEEENSAVQTGDETEIFMWIASGGFAAWTAFLMIRIRAKRKHFYDRNRK